MSRSKFIQKHTIDYLGFEEESLQQHPFCAPAARPLKNTFCQHSTTALRMKGVEWECEFKRTGSTRATGIPFSGCRNVSAPVQGFFEAISRGPDAAP